MNWDNYGIVWEIDHIKPCDSFDLTNDEQQKQCFHYKNTRPLLISENRSKGSKYLSQENSEHLRFYLWVLL